MSEQAIRCGNADCSNTIEPQGLVADASIAPCPVGRRALGGVSGVMKVPSATLVAKSMKLAILLQNLLAKTMACKGKKPISRKRAFSGLRSTTSPGS
jgi:hypothetical protein